MQWFRLYHDTVRDQKIEMCAMKARSTVSEAGWAWIFILDFASRADDRGSVSGLDAELLAISTRMDEAVAQALLDQFMARGMIRDGRVANWDKRQRVSDDAAERQRKTRARRQGPDTPGGGGHRTDADDEQGNPDVPLRNGHVAGRDGTVTERNETVTRQDGNVTRHSANVTRQSRDVAENPLRAQTTDTDSEIESKKEPPLTPPWGDGGELFENPAPKPEESRRTRKSRAKPGPRHAEAEIEEAFGKFMAAYPERDTPHCFDTARRTFGRLVNRDGRDPAELVAAATRYRIDAKGKGSAGTQYVKKPNNWLTSGEWKSYHGLAKFPVAPPENGAKDGGERGDQSWRYEHAKVDMDEMREHWKKLGFVQ